MAKAANITTWIPLRGVPDLVPKAYLSFTYVEIWSDQELIPGLIAGRVRWRATAAKPADKQRGFWQHPHTRFEIDWEQDTITASSWADRAIERISLIGVQLAREDLVGLGLPAPPAAPARP
jgi:hypothetical protein